VPPLFPYAVISIRPPVAIVVPIQQSLSRSSFDPELSSAAEIPTRSHRHQYQALADIGDTSITLDGVISLRALKVSLAVMGFYLFPQLSLVHTSVLQHLD
jgi:hypothetical protein